MITNNGAGHSGTTFQGRRPEPPPTNAPKLRMLPSNNFVFLAHPTRWDIVEIDGVPVVVPQLRRFDFEPGTSGVEQVKGASDGNPIRALAALQERGWTAIPNTVEVRAWGERSQGYVLKYDGERGPVHLDIWTRPQQLGSTVHLEHDTDGFNAWRLSLVREEGLKPAEAVLKALRVKFERAMRKRESSDTSTSRANAERLARKLKVFEPAPPPGPSAEDLEEARSQAQAQAQAQAEAQARDLAKMIQAAVDRAVADARASFAAELAAARDEKSKKPKES